jgi:TonB family protein
VNWIVLILAAALQTPAEPSASTVAPQGQTPSIIQGAHWVKEPAADDLARAYPVLAMHQSMDDHVILRCSVKADGKMSKCKVVKDEQAGFGFDEAALGLARLFTMETTRSDGKSMVGTVVVIPINFISGQKLF